MLCPYNSIQETDMTDSNVQPIEIGSDKQLFIDQRFTVLIERATNHRRQLCQH